MKRYDERVLQELMDRYENSLLYSGENRRRQTISIMVDERRLPEYFDETSRQFEVIHEQLESLEAQGLIRLCWKGKKQGHILEKCILNPERADDIYHRLGRCPRREKEAEILRICAAYEGKNQTLDCFLQYIKEHLEKGESVARYAEKDNPMQFERRCRLVMEMLDNREEVFLREFSARNLGDSKTAEKEIRTAAGILIRFSADRRFENLDEEQVLEECLIFRNPSWIYVKGTGCFHSQGNTIFLENWPDGVGLSARDAERICWQKTPAPTRVVTIENLTTFHRFRESGTLAVYLGGYHNHAKRELLKKIHEVYSDAACFHFGDIDCGGFRIWQDLCRKTGIPFGLRYMDKETYLSCLETGKPLTDHDRKELQKMKEDPFFSGQRELFDLMLKKGRKLEQECIYLR